MKEKELLDKLLRYFFIDGANSLVWGWEEDYPLSKIDKKLNKELFEYFTENAIVSKWS